MSLLRASLGAATVAWMVLAGSCAPMPTFSGGRDLLGTGLVGWQQIDGEEDAWHYENGVLSASGGTGGWLATNVEHGDFMLSLEFRVGADGNSGVFLRAPLTGNPAYQGLEIQILDDYAVKWAYLRPEQYTGSIYGVQAPTERTSERAGKWQTMDILCQGSKVQVRLNGVQIIDADLHHYPDKFAAHPGLHRKRGYVGLQDHGGRIEFRNVRIAEL